MTVSKLISLLSEMPQDAEICIESLDWLGRSHGSGERATFEVFETVDERVCIQSID